MEFSGPFVDTLKGQWTGVVEPNGRVQNLTQRDCFFVFFPRLTCPRNFFIVPKFPIGTYKVTFSYKPAGWKVLYACECGLIF